MMEERERIWRYDYTTYFADGSRAREGFCLAKNEEDAINQALSEAGSGEYVSIFPMPIALFRIIVSDGG